MNGESSPRAGTDSPASSGSPAATPTTPSAVARPPDGGADAVPATSAASGGGTDEPPEGRDSFETMGRVVSVNHYAQSCILGALSRGWTH